MSKYNKKYQLGVKEAYKKNHEEFMAMIKNGHKFSLEKVKKYSERYDLLFEEVMSVVKEAHPFLIYPLMKDPKKQNIHEKIASDILRGILFSSNKYSIEDITELPKIGKNSLVITGDGNIVSPSKITSSQKKEASKSIDFIISIDKHRNIYIAHKHTDESGGAQDNQASDAMQFLEKASKSNSLDYFVAILDGEYYTIDLMKDLRDAYETDKCLIFNMEQFEKWIETIK